MTNTVIGMWARHQLDLTPAPHPAKFSMAILHSIDHILTAEADRIGRRLRIIDQFAGVGRVHHFNTAAHFTVAAELEPEWAMWSKTDQPGPSGPVVISDARRPAFRPGSFDAMVESPSYGNRMRDNHNARDACKHTVKRKGVPVVYPLAECPLCKGTGLSQRNTYRHKLGRPASRGTSTTMAFDDRYRQLHANHYAVMLAPDGPLVSEALIVVNVSNHTETVDRTTGKAEVEHRVAEWHTNELMAQGCNIVRIDRVGTPRNRNGANGDKRVDGELVVVMRAPAKVISAPYQLTLGNAPTQREIVEVGAGGHL